MLGVFLNDVTQAIHSQVHINDVTQAIHGQIHIAYMYHFSTLYQNLNTLSLSFNSYYHYDAR